MAFLASVSSSHGFFYDLFTPLPESQTSANEKDLFDQIAHHSATADGASDFFNLIDCTLSWIKLALSMSADLSKLIGKVDDAANSASMALSIPQIFSDADTLRHSFGSLVVTQDLPYSDPLRSRKIAQAFKRTFLDSIDLTFTLSKAALFLNNAKIWIFDTARVTIINGINNATSLISDGAELISESFKLQHFYSSDTQPRTQAESAKVEEKKRLSMMVVAKDVASVAGSAIALVGIIFGVAVQSMPIMVTVLVLNTAGLAMKLAAYFYNKIIVEAPIRS